MAPDIVTEKNARKQEAFRFRQRFQGSRNLNRESERLKTFNGWKVSFLDSKKLAENGFFYTGTEDVVQCAVCDIQIGFWEQGDDPEADHKRLSPDCPLVKREIRREEEEEGEDRTQEEDMTSQDVCGPYGLEIRPFSGPERPGKIPFTIESANLWQDFEDLGVSKISGPVAPYYATFNARMKTFETWPEDSVQSAEKLAEAGFYYTSFQDNVLCFHCGGGLKNWEPEDDPWVEHAKWFSKCGFVILRKGLEFISEVLSKEKQLMKAQNSKPEEEVKEPSRTETTTTTPEEPSRTETTTTPEEPSRDETTTKPEEKESIAPSQSSQTEEVKSEEKPSQQNPNPEKNELEQCRICYTRDRGIVFLPCGHFFSCSECASSLQSCAVCRTPIKATVRAYLF